MFSGCCIGAATLLSVLVVHQTSAGALLELRFEALDFNFNSSTAGMCCRGPGTSICSMPCATVFELNVKTRAGMLLSPPHILKWNGTAIDFWGSNSSFLNPIVVNLTQCPPGIKAELSLKAYDVVRGENDLIANWSLEYKKLNKSTIQHSLLGPGDPLSGRLNISIRTFCDAGITTRDCSEKSFSACRAGRAIVNPCSSNPCQNRTCVSNATEYRCECYSGYGGDNCQDIIDGCVALQARCGHGRCQPIARRHTQFNHLAQRMYYNCICQLGYTGLDCSVRLDPCANVRCINGACNAVNTSCVCNPGFAGSDCSLRTDDCSVPNNFCFNESFCVLHNGSYRCLCPSGLTGHRCEADVDECMRPAICEHGSCVNTHGGFSCNCSKGFSGPNCDLDIDECGSVQCGTGQCVNTIGSFHCNCSDGYNGSTCEIKAESPCDTQSRAEAVAIASVDFCIFSRYSKDCNSLAEFNHSQESAHSEDYLQISSGLTPDYLCISEVSCKEFAFTGSLCRTVLQPNCSECRRCKSYTCKKNSLQLDCDETTHLDNLHKSCFISEIARSAKDSEGGDILAFLKKTWYMFVIALLSILVVTMVIITGRKMAAARKANKHSALGNVTSAWITPHPGTEAERMLDCSVMISNPTFEDRNSINSTSQLYACTSTFSRSRESTRNTYDQPRRLFDPVVATSVNNTDDDCCAGGQFMIPLDNSNIYSDIPSDWLIKRQPASDPHNEDSPSQTSESHLYANVSE